MKEILTKEYLNIKKLGISPKINYTFNYNFVNGPFLEILGSFPGRFLVQHIDQKDNSVVYEDTINNNMWTQSRYLYFKDILFRVKDLNNNKVIFEHSYNAQGKRVYIHLDSKAIGDTLAWFPYAEEFRKKHKCHVIVSTFYNKWFDKQYPDLEFVEPGTEVYDIYAMYNIGWHYNENGEVNKFKNPTNFRENHLQETATSVLGLDFKEIKPKLNFHIKSIETEKPYVCIAPHASAHAKYWNYPGGWQFVIDYLNGLGYGVKMITQEPLGDPWHDSKLGGKLKNVIDKTGGDFSIVNRAKDILGAKLFIGVGSGLSWLSWALETPTILISGFSHPKSEFQDCERLFVPNEENICNSCFNTHRLDPGDWEWCPNHKGTFRMFECSKSITPSKVIESINKILKYDL